MSLRGLHLMLGLCVLGATVTIVNLFALAVVHNWNRAPTRVEYVQYPDHLPVCDAIESSYCVWDRAVRGNDQAGDISDRYSIHGEMPK